MIHLSGDALKSLEGSHPLIIFHWDVDGIASTALLVKYLGLKPMLYTPKIGFYRLDLDEILGFKGYDSIFIVDFGVDTSSIESLKDEVDSEVYVFDHHLRRESDKITIFPYRDSDGDIYPSESIMVSELLGIEPNFLTVLGFVGDLFGKALENKYSYVLRGEWNSFGFGYRDLKLFVDLIQSNYVFMDRREVESAVYKLMDSIEDPYILLENRLWRERYREMYRVINKVMSTEVESIDGVRMLELEEKLYITSYVGRYLAEKYSGEYVLIGVPELLGGYSQIYLRISGENKLDFHKLIEELNGLGVYAGGKDDVVGVFMDRDRYKEILSFILSWLRRA